MKQLGFARQSLASGAVDNTVDQIQAQINAELMLQSTGGVITADGTEQTLFIENAPLGCFAPDCLFVDLDNMAAGDTTVMRVYYRIIPGGALKLQDYQSYTGADGGLTDGKTLIALALRPNRYGIKITLRQTAGVNRDYPWSVFVIG